MNKNGHIRFAPLETRCKNSVTFECKRCSIVCAIRDQSKGVTQGEEARSSHEESHSAATRCVGGAVVFCC